MTRLKWNRAVTGQRVDRIGIDAGMKMMIEHRSHTRRSMRTVACLKALRERAANGDREAQATVLISQYKSVQGMLKHYELKRKIYGKPNQTAVPRGHIRMRKQDPETGEAHTLDLPIKHPALTIVLRKIANGEPWRHLAPNLDDDQAEFLETGRIK